MKKLSIVCMIILGLVLLTACGGNSDVAGDGNQTVRINFPTATTTGTLYPLGAAMANVWNTELDNVRVSSQASDGGVHNLNLMRDGDAQISFATSGIMLEALEGTGTFEGRPYEDLRIIAGLYYNPNQFVVRKGSGVTNISQIEGKNFTPGAAGSTVEVETGVLLRAYGIDYPDGIRPHFVGFTEAIDLMRNNQIDGAYIQAGLPTAAVTEMISTADGALLSMDEDIIESLMDDYPWYSRFTIPADAYPNQTEGIDTVAIKMMLMADASVSDDLIYDLMKTFWENVDKPALKDAHRIVEQIKIENAASDLSGMPLHPGAERYYREVGIIE
ncbi:TRAP transporter solute receptor, TAXI family [Alkaliphilus metalliredigens QYMF]|uniref:TRAP transporter solute receptor, TAXI family n=1 Tax=Alkaliphilus metalliredigens (strain QYMF) TaxID=293826 RepID=A6TL00_ALKMQ|nr:TAXI family TRAP transporter solute-binding subunit [Alkaliphilus metalliredigens]ABR46868.1 TRAP transporter solute receptor, TAXI family [Alkaliphilus metalliredigens QYMF]